MEDFRITPKNKQYKKRNLKYSVISACYNVEKYIDEFIASIVNQKLSFVENIVLILVDDGSTDKTIEKMKEWKNRFPNNIVYTTQKNQGQGEARNNGLQLVDTPWINFADPDDFLGKDFFYEAESFINNHKDVALISTNMLIFREDLCKIVDSHPLKFKFKEENKIIKILDSNLHIQLSAASSIFDAKLIKKLNLKFNTNLKPNFEDAYFIANYLANNVEKYIGFLSKAKYFYRKRTSKNSSMDLSWQDKRNFWDIFERGKLAMLKKYPQYTFIQNTFLYDFIWHVFRIVDHPERVSFLNAEEKNNYLSIIDECFKYISQSTILKFNLCGAWFYHKVGILNCFKNINLESYQIFYIQDYDCAKNELKFFYYSGKISTVIFKIDNFEIYPSICKIARHDFLTRTFAYQTIVWLPLGKAQEGILSCSIKNKKTIISFNGNQYTELKIEKVIEFFKEKYNILLHKDIWLFLDRPYAADDNAEHLYRWIKSNHQNKTIYFALLKTSRDWERLYNEGFNLIEYGSKEYEEILKASSKIISSQIDANVVNYFKDNSLNYKKIVWLQHGVTKDDLSSWLNSKFRIDVIVTATKDEFNSFVLDNTRYKYTEKEVKLTGFPRFDALNGQYDIDDKKILFMPTWRQSLVGETTFNGERKYRSDFFNSEYALKWGAVFSSDKLRKFSKKYNVEFYIYPHPNIKPYINNFNLSPYIRICEDTHTIQQVFKHSFMLITDYSSVAFDFAYMRKPIIYYQFDEQDVFNGAHSYQKGYFDYRLNGFGPVVLSEEELFKKLECIIIKEKNDDIYLNRIEKTFKFFDNKNSERVYKAIIDLDKTDKNENINIEVLEKFAKMSFDDELWEIACRRYEKLCTISDITKYKEKMNVSLFCKYVEDGNLSQAKNVYNNFNAKIKKENIIEKYFEMLLLFSGKYKEILNIGEEKIKNIYLLVLVNYILEKKIIKFNKIKNDLLEKLTAVNEKNIIPILNKFSDTIYSDIYLCILFSLLADRFKNWDLEGALRQKILTKQGKKHIWRILAALRCYSDGRNIAKDIYINIENAFPGSIYEMPDYFADMYIDSLLIDKKTDKILSFLNILNDNSKISPSKILMLIKKFRNVGVDHESLIRYMPKKPTNDNEILDFVLCLELFKKHREAYEICKTITPNNFELFKKRIAYEEFYEEYEHAIRLLKDCQKIYPEKIEYINFKIQSLNVSKNLKNIYENFKNTAQKPYVHQSFIYMDDNMPKNINCFRLYEVIKNIDLDQKKLNNKYYRINIDTKDISKARLFHVAIDNIYAKNDCFTVGIHDFCNNIKLRYKNYKTASQIFLNFIVGKDAQDIALCLYAGENGKTDNCVMVLGQVSIYIYDFDSVC